MQTKRLKPMVDELDPRNIGGREQLINRMYNHKAALLEAKPTIDIGSKKQSQPHADANKKDNSKPLYKKLQEFGNVYATFKAVAGTQKPQVDSNVPKTDKFKTFWGKKNKAQKFQDHEHELHLKSQQRRINGIGSMQERKKNANDPIAHPTYFLTTDPQPKHNNYMLQQIQKPQKKDNPNDLSRLSPQKEKKQGLDQESGKQLQKKTVRESSAESGKDLQKKKVRPSSAKPTGKSTGVSSFQKQVLNKERKPIVDHSKRPQTAKTITKEDYEKYKRGFELKQSGIEFDFVDEIPITQGVSEKDYDYIKASIVQLIIKYRIYTNRDLKILYGRTVVHNQHMKITRLEEIFEEIKNEFDKQADQEYLKEIPKTKTQNEKDYEFIKTSLTNLIQAYRIYSTRGLKNLFLATAQANTHMSQNKLDLIFTEIQHDLDS